MTLALEHALANSASSERSALGMCSLVARARCTPRNSTISADGTVIVGQVVTALAGLLQQQAFRWTKASGMVALTMTGTASEAAQGVSGDGSVVVGYSSRFAPGSTAPFRWTGNNGLLPLAAVTGATGLGARHISSNGSTAIGYGIDGSGNYVPIKWVGTATGQALPFPLGYNGGGYAAASADGSTIFGTYNTLAGPVPPFRWTQAAGAQLLMQTGSSPVPVWGLSDASDDASILIGTGDSQQGTFIWNMQTGQLQLLSEILQAQGVNLNGMKLFANAISADGNVVVGAATPTMGQNVAFLARFR